MIHKQTGLLIEAPCWRFKNCPCQKRENVPNLKLILTLINYSRACLSSILARSNLCLEIPELKDRKKWPVTPNKKPPETPMYSSLYFRNSDELSSKWLFSTLMNCHLGSIGHGVVDRDILWEGGSWRPSAKTDLTLSYHYANHAI